MYESDWLARGLALDVMAFLDIHIKHCMSSGDLFLFNVCNVKVDVAKAASAVCESTTFKCHILLGPLIVFKTRTFEKYSISLP